MCLWLQNMAKNLGINSFSGVMSQAFSAVSTAGNLGGWSAYVEIHEKLASDY